MGEQKAKRLVIVMIVVLVLALAGIANAGRFTIVNHTGVDLYELYVSPNRKNIWGTDMLHGRILKNNQSCSVIWDTRAINMWDMEGKDAQGGGFIWTGFDVRNIVKITVDTEHAQCQGSK